MPNLPENHHRCHNVNATLKASLIEFCQTHLSHLKEYDIILQQIESRQIESIQITHEKMVIVKYYNQPLEFLSLHPDIPLNQEVIKRILNNYI